MGTTSQTSGDTGRTQFAPTVAVVTGGSRGIGLAIATAFVSRGARVVITGRDEQHLRDAVAANTTSATAGAIHGIRADISQADQAARAVDAAVEKFGGLDVLVNNAGIGTFAAVADMTVKEWQQTIETNLSGAFYCSQAAIPHLKRRGGGWIINISSLAAKNPFAGGAAYCASKAALNAFSEALMQELRYDNIRVSYVMPGSVATGFSGRGDDGKADWKIAPEDVADVVLDLVTFPARSLPSRIEIRPSRPQKS
jgi:3-oxoacyl-[acyl-carrier protein] reductase